MNAAKEITVPDAVSRSTTPPDAESDQTSVDTPGDAPPTPAANDRVAVVAAIAIIVILVGVVSVLVAGTPGKATATADFDTCFANQRSMEGAALVYLNRTGTVAADVTELGTAYAANPPTCPSGGTYVFLTSGPYVTCTAHGSFATAEACANCQ